MPRGIPAKTKAERIARLIRKRWSRQRIIETVGCHEIYYYQIRRKVRQDELAAKLMKAG